MTRVFRRGRADEGFALLTVIGSMTIITLFLLSTLALTLNSMKPSRADQDAKAALAAAQAGIDEYVARLNANDTYWTAGNVDCGNLALTPPTAGTCASARPAAGIAVPGTAGAGTFSYRLLTTTADTTSTGVIRLAVTGRSRGKSRDLVAQLTPGGFLQYIYFTDLEDVDPALDTPNPPATRNFATDYYDSANLMYYVWYADQSLADSLCSKHWYEGRSAPSYTSGAYLERARKVEWYQDASGTTQYRFVSDTTTTKQADAANRIDFSCGEIQFTGGDTVAGKLKTNDAMLVNGSPLFTSPVTETAWSTAPDMTKPWRGTGTPKATGPNGERGYSPTYGGPLEMPDSNAELIAAARTAGVGCLYSGATTLTFLNNGKVRVKSPGTASTGACGGGSGSTDIKLPSVIYVQDLPSSQTCTDQLGFPAAGESTAGRTTTDYSCRKGNAYVSGTVKGRITVGTQNDVVVTGDTTYDGGMTGTDALGLIPLNYAWIYHPVKDDGSNLLATPVRQVDAAILSVNHSFLVQNYTLGAALSTATDDTTKLRVRGAIAQRYRGPVGTGSGTAAGTGYLKAYQYDPRLNNAPPPYFLKPVSSPYSVSQVTD